MKKNGLKNYIPELLAPAGSIESLIAAVNAGADAVYISGKKFGARKFANNFEDSEIRQGLKYAKLRGVKVYVTVNILIKDSQIEEVCEYLIWLYKIGADAVIIQDLGVARLSKMIVPHLDMHASTQMTIHNIPGLEWASKFGFKRVVLSRELGISEIKKIEKRSEELGIEVEIFGHGALCYSYSGQCLLSSFIGGRSGNRGTCAQPCRREYTLFGGKIDKYGRPIDIHPVNLDKKYLLSTRDLSLYQNLVTIAHSKIDSLKIEGRMRSAEYVATVVESYRKALDSILIDKNWKPDPEEISRLKLAFNRGFTGGYIVEPVNTVMGCDAPGNRGLFIGTISKFDRNSGNAVVKIKNKFKLKKGDGVVFLYQNKMRDRFRYGQNEYKNLNKNSDENFKKYGMVLEDKPLYKSNNLFLKLTKPVPIGSKLYLTRSISLIHDAKSIIKKSVSPSIPIDVRIGWDKSLRAELHGEFIGFDGRTYRINLKSDFVMEKAIKKPLSKNQIEKQIQKTGDTPFKFRKVVIDYPGDLFTPISKLNHLRRNFLEKSELKLLSTYKPSAFEVQKAKNRFNDIKKFIPTAEPEENYPKQIVLGVYADSIDTVKGALDGGAERIYFEANRFKDSKDLYNSVVSSEDSTNSSQDFGDSTRNLDIITSELLAAEELCRNHGSEFVWKWPQITHQKVLEMYIAILTSRIDDLERFMVDGLGAADVVNELVPTARLYASAGLNILNNSSILALSKMFDTLTPSAELSKEELMELISISRSEDFDIYFELVVQGNVDTLISKDCIMSHVSKEEIENNHFWGIQDQKKRIFPIKVDLQGFTHILNSVELCLIDHLSEIIQMGVNSVVIDLRTKTYEYSKDMCSIYHSSLNCIENGNYTKKNMNKMKSKIKSISTGGITSGNFLKGIK